MTSVVRSGSRPKITLEITPLFEDHWTGIPVFTRRLIQALMRHGGVEVEFAYQLTKIPNGTVLTAIRAGSGTAMRGDFERKAGETHALIDADAPFLFPSVKECFKTVTREASTIHDVSTLVMPEYHERTNVDYHMRSVAAQLATDEVVFCVSEATRAALTLAYPSASGKMRVLPQYVDWPPSFAAIERNLPAPVAGRYAAVIGTIEPRKNLNLLIRALREPALRDSEIRFAVIGKQGWKMDALLTQLSPPERERLIFLGYVTEFMKYRLLRHAEFLVYPSIYEGFGIPALEAMSLGKPVLAAMTSSFPEVIGEAGIYFDPLSVSQFAEAFAQIADVRTLKELAPKALAGAGTYGWERMAEPVVVWVLEGQ